MIIIRGDSHFASKDFMEWCDGRHKTGFVTGLSGNKKLHEKHLGDLHPDILTDGANVSALIDGVAPGRPCTHKPMKEIIAKIIEGN